MQGSSAQSTPPADPRRTRAGSLALVVAGTMMASLMTAGLDAADAAPRRTHHQPPAATARDTDTTATATIPGLQAKTRSPRTTQPKAMQAAPVPQSPAASLDDDGALPPPFHLPSAPRSRMRDCGLQWQAMKQSGQSGEQIWRDFATACLTAAAGPIDRHSER